MPRDQRPLFGSPRTRDPRDSVERKAAIALTGKRLEAIVVVLGVSFLCGHLLLLSWWVLERGEVSSAPNLGVTVNLSPNLTLSRADKEEVDAAVDEILASRGDEPRVRRPLADLRMPGSEICSGRLPAVPPGGCTEEGVEQTLSRLFKESVGYWAGGADEAASIKNAAEALGGEAGFCAEATYGEMTVPGLRTLLTSLAQIDTGVDGAPHGKFSTFLDLGAGPGKTAAAALILGFARRAMGVELGPQRFAMGCKAISAAEALTDDDDDGKTPHACRSFGLAGKKAMRPQLDLIHGDAQNWPELAKAHEWPDCDASSAIFMGAECFRDALMLSIGRAILRSCAAGARVAVVGRRFPRELEAPSASASVRWLELVSSVVAPASWSATAEVFLYRVVPGVATH